MLITSKRDSGKDDSIEFVQEKLHCMRVCAYTKNEILRLNDTTTVFMNPFPTSYTLFPLQLAIEILSGKYPRSSLSSLRHILEIRTKNCSPQRWFHFLFRWMREISSPFSAPVETKIVSFPLLEEGKCWGRHVWHPCPLRFRHVRDCQGTIFAPEVLHELFFNHSINLSSLSPV